MRRQRTSEAARRPQRVYLVDGYALMRRVAAEWIDRCSSLTVCGMAGGRGEAFKAIKRLRPDIVVSEIMGPLNLDFIRELRQRHPRLPILVFTMQEEELFRDRAKEAGASGYLTKGVDGGMLVTRIWKVLQGQAGLRAAMGTRVRREGISAGGAARKKSWAKAPPTTRLTRRGLGRRTASANCLGR